MEYEKQLESLLKNKDVNNLTLAYIITVEAGIMTFMEFLMMLMVSTHPISETNNGTEIPKDWKLLLRRELTKKESGGTVFLLIGTLSFNMEMLLHKGKYSYNFSSYNGHDMIYSCKNEILKNDISNKVTKIFKKEIIFGHKSGIVKFVGFLMLMEHLENNHIDEIHKLFRKFIHL